MGILQAVAGYKLFIRMCLSFGKLFVTYKNLISLTLTLITGLFIFPGDSRFSNEHNPPSFGVATQFPKSQFYLTALVNFKLYHRIPILNIFNPNPEQYFEFTQSLPEFILSYHQCFNFICTKNKFHPFIRKLHRHPTLLICPRHYYMSQMAFRAVQCSQC